MSGIRSIYRGAVLKGYTSAASAPLRVDNTNNRVYVAPAGSGVAEVELVTQNPIATITGDGAVAIANGTTYLTKGSAAAVTVAAPGTNGIGVEMTITGGSDFAHVVTFTGSTLRDGTTGAKVTWTSAAFAGSSITVIGVSATVWNVVSKNLGTVA